MDRKKPPLPRRVWRVTPEAPMGEFVDLDPTSLPGPASAIFLAPIASAVLQLTSWASREGSASGQAMLAAIGSL